VRIASLIVSPVVRVVLMSGKCGSRKAQIA
jgi:hypothetical protein